MTRDLMKTRMVMGDLHDCLALILEEYDDPVHIGVWAWHPAWWARLSQEWPS